MEDDLPLEAVVEVEEDRELCMDGWMVRDGWVDGWTEGLEGTERESEGV